MKVLVIGNEGQVARSIREAAAAFPDITFHFGSRPEIDLLAHQSIERAVSDFAPDAVINPAAYTAVDKAESEPEQALAVNCAGAEALAKATAKRGIPIIHFSTDYVFDGSKPSAYVETDEPSPIGVYGKSKLAGELAIADINARHVILRTSWVYSPFGNNFLRTMLRLSKDRDTVRVVNDQVGCPTYAPAIADAVIRIALQLQPGVWEDRFAGVTNMASPDAMTWFDFARKIFDAAERRDGRKISVQPITTAEYPTPAKRPANSHLSTERLRATFGIELPSVNQSIDDCLNRIS